MLMPVREMANVMAMRLHLTEIDDDIAISPQGQARHPFPSPAEHATDLALAIACLLATLGAWPPSHRARRKLVVTHPASFPKIPRLRSRRGSMAIQSFTMDRPLEIERSDLG